MGLLRVIPPVLPLCDGGWAAVTLDRKFNSAITFLKWAPSGDLIWRKTLTDRWNIKKAFLRKNEAQIVVGGNQGAAIISLQDGSVMIDKKLPTNYPAPLSLVLGESGAGFVYADRLLYLPWEGHSVELAVSPPIGQTTYSISS